MSLLVHTIRQNLDNVSSTTKSPVISFIYELFNGRIC